MTRVGSRTGARVRAGGLAAGLVLAALAGPALAGVAVTYETGGRNVFSVEVPDNWVAAVGGTRAAAPDGSGMTDVPRVLGLTPETDPRVWVGFYVPPGVPNLVAAREFLKSLDGYLVEDPQVSPRSTTRVGGRPAEMFRGTGTREGKPVTFTIATVQMSGNRVVVAAFIGEEGARGIYTDELNSIVRSFRAIQ
ncbi:hypothetical protein [Oceanomicrobium pacificus]|uniref:Uncharacterized protein n=1 Tax=Oceanomicrobium pacificus TaxID=2692916 RepID=A0A6B0TNJ2_9RHOB|nr:hypothetical protein [Oceanomicrobium pacificus]MXU65436.1 hypothetical protein [Oceanomicrobium pacificus]